jgi:hypothetical protein
MAENKNETNNLINIHNTILNLIGSANEIDDSQRVNKYLFDKISFEVITEYVGICGDPYLSITILIESSNDLNGEITLLYEKELKSCRIVSDIIKNGKRIILEINHLTIDELKTIINSAISSNHSYSNTILKLSELYDENY